MSSGKRARDLVLVRTGRRSHHLSFAPADRGKVPWHCAISTYQDVPDELLEGADYVHHTPGGKWNGVFDFFKNNPEALDRYEYFWIPDDDITTGVEDVARLFERVREFDLELAQPSLTLTSRHYHHITLKNDAFTVRRTNFVELMVPVFHRDLLKKLMHMFEGNWAGLGLDMIWPNYTSDVRSSVGIVDDVVVHHHGELGTFLYGNMRRAGIVPMIEYRQNARKFNIKPRIPFAHAGVKTDGAAIRGNLKMIGQDIAARRRNKGKVPHNPVTLHNIARLLYAYFDSYRITLGEFLTGTTAKERSRSIGRP